MARGHVTLSPRTVHGAQPQSLPTYLYLPATFLSHCLATYQGSPVTVAGSPRGAVVRLPRSQSNLRGTRDQAHGSGAINQPAAVIARYSRGREARPARTRVQPTGVRMSLLRGHCPPHRCNMGSRPVAQ